MTIIDIHTRDLASEKLLIQNCTSLQGDLEEVVVTFFFALSSMSSKYSDGAFRKSAATYFVPCSRLRGYLSHQNIKKAPCKLEKVNCSSCWNHTTMVVLIIR